MPSSKPYRGSSTLYEGRTSFGKRATYIITESPEPRYSEKIRPILVHKSEPVRRRQIISREHELDLAPVRSNGYPIMLHQERPRQASPDRALQPLVEYDWRESRSERRERHRSVQYIDREPDDYDFARLSSSKRVHFEPQLVEHKSKKYYRDSDGNWLRWRKVEQNSRSSRNFLSFL